MILPMHIGVAATTVESDEDADESWRSMSAAEKIMIAEEKVAGLQSQLKTVETVLETAEQVAVAGEKAGRCLRRSLWALLGLSVIAIIVLVVRKVMGDGCPMGKKKAADDVGDETPAGDEAAPEGDADAS